MLRDYLANDPNSFEELKLESRDYAAIAADRERRSIQAILKLCIGLAIQARGEIFSSEVRPDEANTEGAIQAFRAYARVAQVIQVSGTEEQEEEDE